MSKTWDDVQARALVDYTSKLLTKDKALRAELERSVRAGTGTDMTTSSSYCCHSRFQKSKTDRVGEILEQKVSFEGLWTLLPRVVDAAGRVYFRMAQKQCLSPDSAEAPHVRHMTLRAALIKETTAAVHEELMRDMAENAKDMSLFANPSGVDARLLDRLPNESISRLMRLGFAVIPRFVDESSAILAQCERLESDGALSVDYNLQPWSQRSDMQAWISADDMDRESYSNLINVLLKLEFCPYELNAKAQLQLLHSNRFELSLFHKDRSGYRRHIDNTPRAGSGVRFTVMFFPNDPNWSEGDGGYVRLWRAGEEVATVKPAGGDLLLLKSEVVDWAVLPTRRKRFAISTWLCGPKSLLH